VCTARRRGRRSDASDSSTRGRLRTDVSATVHCLRETRRSVQTCRGSREVNSLLYMRCALRYVASDSDFSRYLHSLELALTRWQLLEFAVFTYERVTAYVKTTPKSGRKRKACTWVQRPYTFTLYEPTSAVHPFKPEYMTRTPSALKPRILKSV